VAELVFDWLGARAERFSVVPALTLCLRISETTSQPVDAIALRCQIRIEPHRRRYGEAEARRAARSLRRSQPVGGHAQAAPVHHGAGDGARVRGSTDLDLPVPFTYDLQISATRYFASLDDGEVPLLLLFSGTVFRHRRRPAPGAAGAMEQGDQLRPAGQGLAGRRSTPTSRTAPG
jgi:hypothetical protein